MSVDTKALLNGQIDLITLANDLVTEYGTDRHDVEIKFTFMDDYFKINFTHKHPANWSTMTYFERSSWMDKNNPRSMGYHLGCKSDYKHVTTNTMTDLTLGCWGESVEIMESLLKKYGGYIMRSDSTDEWEAFGKEV